MCLRMLDKSLAEFYTTSNDNLNVGASMKRTMTKKAKTITVDSDGVYNEVTDFGRVTYETDPPFIKLYLNDIATLYNLPLSASSFLMCLLRKLDYDSVISLNSTNKKRMAEEIGTTVATLDNQLNKLIKKNIVKRIGRGEFMMNPMLFARGTWEDITKLRDKYFKLEVTYSPLGKRTVKATEHCEENNQQEGKYQ